MSSSAVLRWNGPVDVQLIGLCGPIRDQAMNLAAHRGVNSVHGAAASNPVVMAALRQHRRGASDILAVGTNSGALRIYVR